MTLHAPEARQRSGLAGWRPCTHRAGGGGRATCRREEGGNAALVRFLKERHAFTSTRVERALLAVDRGDFVHGCNPYEDHPQSIGKSLPPHQPLRRPPPVRRQVKYVVNRPLLSTVLLTETTTKETPVVWTAAPMAF